MSDRYYRLLNISTIAMSLASIVMSAAALYLTSEIERMEHARDLRRAAQCENCVKPAKVSRETPTKSYR